MPEIAVNCEIHFHEQEVLSISHETNVGDIEEQFAELAYASAFAIRSISNLGDHKLNDTLATQLQMLEQLFTNFPNETLKPKPKIIGYPGFDGRKQLIGRLRLRPTAVHLEYEANGFGALASGVGYYVPVGTISLFRYFSSRRANDCAYLATLGRLASACAHLQLRRQIESANHAQLLCVVMRSCMSAYLPTWLELP